jgi:hypothetical protein
MAEEVTCLKLTPWAAISFQRRTLFRNCTQITAATSSSSYAGLRKQKALPVGWCFTFCCFNFALNNIKRGFITTVSGS